MIRITLLILFVHLSFNINAFCLNGKRLITYEYRDFINKNEFFICWHRGEKLSNCFRAGPEIIQNKAYIITGNSNTEEWLKLQNE